MQKASLKVYTLEKSSNLHEIAQIIKTLHLPAICNLNPFPYSDERGWGFVFP